MLISKLEFPPYLLTLTIRTPTGDPLPGALIDLWQATTDGHYSQNSYNLRGKFKTDTQGQIEILTIVPGQYGPLKHARAGHFHLMISGGEQYELLVTQLYVCSANDRQGMMHDLYVTKQPSSLCKLMRCAFPTA